MIRILLSDILEQHDMSQVELSRKTEIRPATINELYHEQIERINLKYLSKICEVLDCDVQDILRYIPDSEYYKRKIRSSSIQ